VQHLVRNVACSRVVTLSNYDALFNTVAVCGTQCNHCLETSGNGFHDLTRSFLVLCNLFRGNVLSDHFAGLGGLLFGRRRIYFWPRDIDGVYPDGPLVFDIA
jgi:hypothetical protein